MQTVSTTEAGPSVAPNVEAVRWIARQLDWEQTLRDLRAGATERMIDGEREAA
jgi:hypothetical protein